jgi:hypothetical protein
MYKQGLYALRCDTRRVNKVSLLHVYFASLRLNKLPAVGLLTCPYKFL